RYHRAHGHVTEECIHLKDAIAVEEEKPATGGQKPKQIAMSIWRPEYFYVLEDISAEFSALSR
ncbi:hypothetical protein A2U01_0108589, partial [Trifolium medium]|nr:hypothetical protein [Trifolium medium]